MKHSVALLVLALTLLPASALARDEYQDHSIADAMSLADAKAKLGGSVKFYFGDTAHPKVKVRHGEFGSNKKTNAFNKSDKAACERAFLSAMISLQQRAQREGGNAVVNIRSNYRGNTTASNDTFRCGAGNVMAGVALLGEVVTVE